MFQPQSGLYPQSGAILGPRYGAAVLKAPSEFVHGRRRSMNGTAIGLNLFVPWLLFCLVFATMSFELQYNNGIYQVHLTHLILLPCFAAVLVTIYLAYAFKRRRMSNGWTEGEPTWLMFAAVAMTIAFVLGLIFGDINWFFNIQPYKNAADLNTFTAVNPAKDKGEALMDAGQVYFTEGTTLDLDKAMSFRNTNLYCVAPIVYGTQKLEQYDFWAVGVDCCTGTLTSDFRCGEFNNEHARAGLRLLKDADRAFFRLAVQQAETAFDITAVHPLFFTWMQDPSSELAREKFEGFKYYLLGIATHFVFNAFCVACAVLGFSKIGRFYGPDQH